MSSKQVLVFLAVFLLIAVQATFAASRHPRQVNADADAEIIGDVDPTKVLNQMYETVKKTIDSVTSPDKIGATVEKMKAMGDSIVKMGLDFAKTVTNGSG